MVALLPQLLLGLGCARQQPLPAPPSPPAQQQQQQQQQATSSLPPPPLVPAAGSCGCAGFCAGTCSYNASSTRRNLTLFRRTPHNDLRLADHDTGSLRGETEFSLYSFSWAQECRDSGSCLFLMNSSVYVQYTVEVDGQFGPYLACNPNVTAGGGPFDWHCDVHGGPPEWSSCQWRRGTQASCPRALRTVGKMPCDFACSSSGASGGGHRPAWSVWRCNVSKLFAAADGATGSGPGGANRTWWYSTPASGRCIGSARPGDGSGCTWRQLSIDKVVPTAAVDSAIASFVVDYASSGSGGKRSDRFDECGPSPDRGGFCWSSAFYDTISGNRSALPPINPSHLVDQWWRAFDSAASVLHNAVATTSIAVDYSASAAPIDFQYGVDHGPDCTVPPGAPEVNVATDLLAMGASLIRTHDSGVLDWPVIFPHSLSLAGGVVRTADTSDPSNYEWDKADAFYAKIVESGLEPYFRLGTSWGQLGGGLPPAGLPYNRSALVDVLLHTVMRYTEGWGGGQNLSSVGHTRFFEVWNEPDSSCSYAHGPACGRFWNRSAADFYDLIDDTIRAIKAYDSTLVVGADGVANARSGDTAEADHPHPGGYIHWANTDIVCSKIKGACDLGTDMLVASIGECEGQCNATAGCAAFVSWNSSSTPGTPYHCQLKRIMTPGFFDPTKTRSVYVRVFAPITNPYSWGLIAELGKRKTPIDFISWHGYIDQPGWYADTIATVRQHLQAAGLPHVKQHITEWFPCILCPMQDTDHGAAAFGGTLIAMVEGSVSLATLYPACSMDEGNRTGGKGWGLFDAQSVPDQALWRPLTHVFAQFGELLQTTPHRLTATVLGTTPATASGVSVLAGRSPVAEGPATLKLLIVLLKSNTSSVRVAVSGLPRLATMRYSVVLTNHSGVALGGIAQVSTAGALELPAFEAPSVAAVAFVRIEQEQE